MTFPARFVRSPRSSASRLSAAIAVAFVTAALLAGCSAPASTGGPATDTDQSGDAPAADGGFCSEFEANGGNGSTIGPVQTWLTKEEILPDVQDRVDAMGEIEPPDEIAGEWAIMKTYYTDLLAATEALPAGGHLSDATLTAAPDEYNAVVDYYFATC